MLRTFLWFFKIFFTHPSLSNINSCYLCCHFILHSPFRNNWWINFQVELRNEPPTTFHDRVFVSEMNKAIQETRVHYENMLYKEAVKAGFFEFQVIISVQKLSTEIRQGSKFGCFLFNIFCNEEVYISFFSFLVTSIVSCATAWVVWTRN